MKKLILLSLLGGVVMFIWGFISWAILPWHMSVANKFTDEAAVSQVLKQNAPQAGVYFLPFDEKDHGPGQTGAFANVLPDGTAMNIGKQMLISLLTQTISAFIGLLIIVHTARANFLHTVGLFGIIGLIISFASHAPYWNWFGFSSSYTLVIIADTTIAWLLAGLAIGKFLSPTSPH